LFDPYNDSKAEPNANIIFLLQLRYTLSENGVRTKKCISPM